MDNEVWRPVKGWEAFYLVSNKWFSTKLSTIAPKTDFSPLAFHAAATASEKRTRDLHGNLCRPIN